jgi:hypothetical protein
MPDDASLDPLSRFEVVPAKSGIGWCVRMRRAFGLIQYINGFDTEAEAAGWIANEGDEWFAKTERAENNV